MPVSVIKRYSRSQPDGMAGTANRVSTLLPGTLQLHDCVYASRSSLHHIWLELSTGSAIDATLLVTGLCDTLESIHGGNNLQKLTLRIESRCLDIEILQPGSVLLEAWKRVDDVLMTNNGGGYPRLREVSITWVLFLEERMSIHKDTPDSELLGHISSLLQDQLQCLSGTAKFKFQSTVSVKRLCYKGYLHIGRIIM